MNVDQRFALIDRDGALRYPYKKRELSSGRYGYALGSDKAGRGEYIDSLEAMIRAVVFDGKMVRVKSLDGDPSKQGNSVSLHAKREITGYVIDPSLFYLVENAEIQPEAAELYRELCMGVIDEPASGPLATIAGQEIDQDPRCSGISVTERHALINARIGQGGYRRRMLKLWGSRCSLTGCSIETVLIASHAKAWVDSTNAERLDEYNGFLLAASIDKLFDAGFVSFSDEGQLIVKSVIKPDDLLLLGLESDSKLRFVHERHKIYLSAHRAQHGF